jgi:hypothetical protein
MTSISEIHRQSVLEHVAKSLYSTGVRPSTSTILHILSKYFRENPPGQPLKRQIGSNATKVRSDPDAVNASMANIMMNLSLLYRANFTQGQEIMELNTLLRTYLDKLVVKRKKLFNQIDDYLLSLYNTDGYYFSISDGFSDLSQTSLDMTSAFVDVAAGKVTLPITKSISVDMSVTGIPRAKAEVFTTGSLTDITNIDSSTELKPIPYVTVGDMTNAFDGMTNTVWSIEVERDKKSEIIVDATIILDSLGRQIEVSRIEFDTYGIVPVQLYCETIDEKSDAKSFGQAVVTTDTRAAFLDATRGAISVKFRMRKTEPDYTYVKAGKTYYKYVFGAKEIYITRSVYDHEATFVSSPINMTGPFASFIDAVSLHVEDNIPEGTTVDYYICKDDPNATEAEQFDWKPVTPVQNIGDNKVIRFNATTQLSNFIRYTPGSSEFQLIRPDSSNGDRKLRNPSDAILTRGSVYRIAEIGDDFIPETLELEEGFNTVRVYYKPYRQGNYQTLNNWLSVISGETSAGVAYNRIDTGQGFFSPIVLGEANRSFYVETYIESSEDRQTIIREALKTSQASRTWDVKLFLNGEEIAEMSAEDEIHSIPVSWKINKGLNHLAMLVDIPAGTTSVPHPEWGVFELMKEDDLYNYGLVRLNKWSYVDEFTLNEDTTTVVRPSESVKFSVVNGEIISRVKPTDNFRLRYAKPNEQGPDAIRVKAELSRTTDDPNVSPSIDLYRIRFQYGDS